MSIYKCAFTATTTGTHSLPADADILEGSRAVGAGGGGGNCKKEGKRRHTQTQSCTATGPCRSFSKKQFKESGSSSLAQSPPSWCSRFGWEPRSDHNSCHRRFRVIRFCSSSSLALAYVARTRTFILRSHFRLNHFCQALLTIICSSCVLITQVGPPAISTTATMLVQIALDTALR